LINRTPTRLLDGKTPYEALSQQKPLYDRLGVFTSLCFAHKKGKDKFASLRRKRAFVRYSYGKNRWTLYDLDTYEFFESMDVTFHEEILTFINLISTTKRKSSASEC